MEDKYKLNITSIQYKNNDKATKDFVSLIVSYIINHNLIKKDGIDER
ncbi:hypothetical protein [Alkaliphilus hydrothermalis]|uniref:Uncharacterized protein n=1 Tax=Alkaliphilus hydrothermalis TaxID=1482730 RepID=A0ABS2NU15_9FIRM|nr:hypothetical protein [Alkaliphilus hydrothermalis]MBM7616311.1 hypothetical protein [Alkaliphilus hydrothermalis]